MGFCLAFIDCGRSLNPTGRLGVRMAGSPHGQMLAPWSWKSRTRVATERSWVTALELSSGEVLGLPSSALHRPSDRGSKWDASPPCSMLGTEAREGT